MTMALQPWRIWLFFSNNQITWRAQIAKNHVLITMCINNVNGGVIMKMIMKIIIAKMMNISSVKR